LRLRALATTLPKPAVSKSFLVLFFKKEPLACLTRLNINQSASAEECHKGIIVPFAGGERQYRSHRIFFAGDELFAVEFEKQDTQDKSRSLIAVNKRVIFNDASGIGRRLAYA
jgi:hypothetical protein